MNKLILFYVLPVFLLQAIFVSYNTFAFESTKNEVEPNNELRRPKEDKKDSIFMPNAYQIESTYSVQKNEPAITKKEPFKDIKINYRHKSKSFDEKDYYEITAPNNTFSIETEKKFLGEKTELKRVHDEIDLGDQKINIELKGDKTKNKQPQNPALGLTLPGVYFEDFFEVKTKIEIKPKK